MMAGPCSVESREQIERSAELVARARGAPSSAAGLSSRAARLTRFRDWARRAWRCCAQRPTGNGLVVVSEVMDQTQIPLLARYADILQVGARNMQNFTLLRELGKLRQPVMLKRGPSGHHRGTAAFGRVYYGRAAITT